MTQLLEILMGTYDKSCASFIICWYSSSEEGH